MRCSQTVSMSGACAVCSIPPSAVREALARGSRPSTHAAPASARTDPRRTRTAAVLPAAFGPSRAVTSPGRNARETRSSTTRVRNRLLSSCSTAIGTGSDLCAGSGRRGQWHSWLLLRQAGVLHASLAQWCGEWKCPLSGAGATLAIRSLRGFAVAAFGGPASGPSGSAHAHFRSRLRFKFASVLGASTAFHGEPRLVTRTTCRDASIAIDSCRGSRAVSRMARPFAGQQARARVRSRGCAGASAAREALSVSAARAHHDRDAGRARDRRAERLAWIPTAGIS